MGSSDGRSHRKYRDARETLKREAPWICGRCGEGIDPTLPPRHPWSWTAGHIVPVRDCAAAGIDPNDVSNLRPEHYTCNARGGAEMTNAARGVGTHAKAPGPIRSRVWR